MTTVFGSAYASVYDTLYADKDYERECDDIEGAFKQHGDRSIQRILDLGAGTGGHAFPLARRGYDVHGVDLSSGMIERARVKAAGVGGLKPRFTQGDIRSVEIGERFDAALMMFAVLGYQAQNDDVLAALANARRHLRDGGLLVFDVWHGPAVMTHPPTDRVRVMTTQSGRVLRLTRPEMDIRANVCRVQFHTFDLRGSVVERESEETHVMRYFSLPELDLLLKFAGFAPLRYSPFPVSNEPVTQDTWNILCIARAATPS